MRRAYNVHTAGGWRDLVLDIPLYSASMEHLADRCGHELIGHVNDMVVQHCMIPGYDGLYGVQMLRADGPVPVWNIEPIMDGRYTYSFFFHCRNPRGHGWGWEFFGNVIDYRIEEYDDHVEVIPYIREAIEISNAFSYGGTARRFFAGLLGYGGIDVGYRGVFCFVTVVVEGATVGLYVNGELEAVGDKRFSYPFDKVGFRSKDTDGYNNTDAVFRQFKLFRRSLTPDEVAALYAEELAEFNAAAAG